MVVQVAVRVEVRAALVPAVQAVPAVHLAAPDLVVPAQVAQKVGVQVLAHPGRLVPQEAQ